VKATATQRIDNGSLRHRLISSAREVFSEEGYQKASIREIARRSGVTPAAIYYHFADKEDLLFTLIEEFTEHFISTLMSVVARQGDPVEKMASLISAHLNMLLSNRGDIKILAAEKHNLSKQRLAFVRAREKDALRIYRTCLDEMRKGGHLSEIEIDAAAFSIIGAINSLHQWYRSDGKLEFETIRQSMLNLILSGLCQRGREDFEALPSAGTD
jgi:TetR/AcrR family transcriptional regulator, cholesterol catabolism regulator